MKGMSSKKQHVLVVVLCFLTLVQTRPISYYQEASPPTIAFAFSGAGGRIGQLVALAETLINGTYPNGTQIIPSYITGVSSGAIVAVAISALLENSQQNITGGLSYADFHDILFGLQDSDVFSTNIKKMVEDMGDGNLLDNSPLRNFLGKTLQRVNYYQLGDLYIPTTISTVDQRTGVTVRLSSTNPEHSKLPILDVLIASASIPLAFPPGTIPALSQYSKFLDGATGIDSVPVVPLLSVPSLQTAYVITYNYAITHGIIDDNRPLTGDYPTIVTYAVQAFNILNGALAVGALGILREADFSGYVYEPNFTNKFSMIDFSSCETQYNLAKEWAMENSPLPVQVYDLKPTFSPNYTLIDQELALYALAPPTATASLIFSLMICVALILL